MPNSDQVNAAAAWGGVLASTVSPLVDGANPGDVLGGPHQGAPFTGRGKRCAGHNNTCMGWKTQGTEYCRGHLLQLKKRAAQDATPIES